LLVPRCFDPRLIAALLSADTRALDMRPAEGAPTSHT
jgi:hypothetical protein